MNTTWLDPNEKQTFIYQHSIGKHIIHLFKELNSTHLENNSEQKLQVILLYYKYDMSYILSIT